MTAFLFGTVVFAWGFTWLAIRFQLGHVPPEVSIFYRFALAAAMLWVLLALTGRLKRVRLADHARFAPMGLSLFGLNFLLVYMATQHIASGVASVVFTTATVFNAINQYLFLGKRPKPRTLAGAALGITGIGLLFFEEIRHMDAGGTAAIGIAMMLVGTIVFSLGNILSLRATATGIDLPNATARGMTWGAAFLGLFALLRGQPFTFDTSAIYVSSLLYLAVVGSVVGFLAYLSLVARIGPDRAAYATILFPVIALTLSTVVEGYQWSAYAAVGLPLILLGNVVIFAKLPTAKIGIPPAVSR